MSDRPTADEYVALRRRLNDDQRHLVALLTFLTGERPDGEVWAWEVIDALASALDIDSGRIGTEGWTLRKALAPDVSLPPVMHRYRAAQIRKGARKYGVTLADAGLSVDALARHAMEEVTDLAAYLRALSDRLTAEGSTTRPRRALIAARRIEQIAAAVLGDLAPEPGEASDG